MSDVCLSREVGEEAVLKSWVRRTGSSGRKKVCVRLAVMLAWKMGCCSRDQCIRAAGGAQWADGRPRCYNYKLCVV
jgi:hypothetical protein